MNLVIAAFLVSAWWLNLFDAVVTWLGYSFFGMRESNEMLGACIRRFGLSAVMLFKVAAVTWVVGWLLHLDLVLGYNLFFATVLLVAAFMMFALLSGALAWNLWVIHNKFSRRFWH